MGYHTTCAFKLALKKNEETTKLYNGIKSYWKANDDRAFIDKDKPFGGLVGISHPFFDCDRADMLFFGSNFDDYTKWSFDDDGDHYSVYVVSEFKNYDSEIDKFAEWVKPHVDLNKSRLPKIFYVGENDFSEIGDWWDKGGCKTKKLWSWIDLR